MSKSCKGTDMVTSIENREGEVDLANFKRAGLITGITVEQMFGIPHARLVRPINLACIGLSVFANEEFPLVKPANLEIEEQKALDTCDKSYLVRHRITALEFRERCRSLLGEEDYSRGEIGEAIKQLLVRGEDDKSETIRSAFAALMAYNLKLSPGFIPEPGVWLDGSFLCLTGVQQVFDLFKQPEVMIEYGPGIVGSRRIPGEVYQTRRSVFIEKNSYTAQVLARLALLHGIKKPQFIVENSVISSATERLLDTGLDGQADIIVASQIYSAGSQEIIKGIQNGKKLLRTGGTFAVMTRLQVEPAEMGGEEILKACREVFGDEENFYPFTYTTLASRKEVDAYYAVFKNP